MPARTGRRIAIVTVMALIVIAGTLVWLSRDHIRFLLAFESLGRNAQGYAEYRHRQTGIVFVSLPGGTFLMGSPEDEEGRSDDEGPVHEVTLSPFMIAKYEVTQEQWEAVMGSNPSRFMGANLPVETVSWEECRTFCERTGLSLPTEAQWEYSCRAGTTGPIAGSGSLDEVGWHEYNSDETSHPVGHKQPNDFGLHDMHGNVAEWCEDWYDEERYHKSVRAVDPVCKQPASESRVIRGGCWETVDCRSATRLGCRPAPNSNWVRGFFGFRVSSYCP